MAYDLRFAGSCWLNHNPGNGFTVVTVKFIPVAQCGVCRENHTALHNLGSGGCIQQPGIFFLTAIIIASQDKVAFRPLRPERDGHIFQVVRRQGSNDWKMMN
ncbi:hypothetical protein MMF83_00022230 [Klebsiella pneumoniae]